MELTKLELVLNTDKEPLGTFASSLMHGFIMESVNGNYADRLHEIPVNLFAQHIERIGEKQSRWTVTTITKEAKEQIILPLIVNSGRKIYIRHNDQELNVVKQDLTVITEDELMEQTYFADPRKVIPVTFDTSTAFRVGGKYQIYPTVRHILQSLIRKHDAVSEETEVYQDGLIEKFEQIVEIIGYDLHSTGYPLEGVRIPSFRGKIRLLVRGPSQLAALIRMLLTFGEYSGVGIKCAMGMGSIKVTG